MRVKVLLALVTFALIGAMVWISDLIPNPLAKLFWGFASTALIIAVTQPLYQKFTPKWDKDTADNPRWVANLGFAVGALWILSGLFSGSNESLLSLGGAFFALGFYIHFRISKNKAKVAAE